MTLATVTAPSLLGVDQPPRKGRRRAFFNNKGGVGKTTTTIQIGFALARAGNRVLLVDMEPQGNLSTSTGLELPPDALTIGEVLDERRKGGARDAIYPCRWDIPEAAMVDVIPSTLTLGERDTEVQLVNSFNRLAKVMYGVTDEYDYTLFDCRPNLAHLEQMVVRCLEEPGDGYYVVVQPARHAITGAYRVIDEVGRWSNDLDVPAPALGIVVNLFDGRTRMANGRAENIPASLARRDGKQPPPVLKPYVPQAVRIAELLDQNLPATGDQRMIREGHLDRYDQLAALVDAA